MAEEPVHYELFIRRSVHSAWTLDCATESRASALAQAEEALGHGRAVGVKVCKEVLRASGEYAGVVIFSKGDLEPPRRRGRWGEEAEPALCVSPPDLYTVHARARIGRLLEGWLARQGVTPFELLHRPDLVERLEASGLELQHAMQKVAIPEAQAKGASTHEVIRRYQKLVEAAVSRLMADARRKLFPDLAALPLEAALAAAQGAVDPGYVLGVAVAQVMAGAATVPAKLARLLDLADQAPAGQGRRLLFQVLEQPLCELLAAPGLMAALAGAGEAGEPAEFGEVLELTVRLVAPEAAARLARSHSGALAPPPPPPLQPGAARLARWLEEPLLEGARAALAHRLLAELLGGRRLHPGDPEAEIAALRRLARLLALSPEAAAPDAVQEAFVSRSRRLLDPDFVQALVAQAGGGVFGEAHALLRLAENMVGASAKRAAAGWLKASLDSLRFERAAAAAPDGPAASLARLAELQRAVGRIGLAAEDRDELSARLGQVGAGVEAAAKLVQAIGRAAGPSLPRLLLLLRMVSGEAAPDGPVGRRARAEIVRMMREPTLRAELAAGAPEALERVRQVMQTAQAAGVAA